VSTVSACCGSLDFFYFFPKSFPVLWPRDVSLWTYNKSLIELCAFPFFTLGLRPDCCSSVVRNCGGLGLFAGGTGTLDTEWEWRDFGLLQSPLIFFSAEAVHLPVDDQNGGVSVAFFFSLPLSPPPLLLLSKRVGWESKPNKVPGEGALYVRVEGGAHGAVTTDRQLTTRNFPFKGTKLVFYFRLTFNWGKGYGVSGKGCPPLSRYPSLRPPFDC